MINLRLILIGRHTKRGKCLGSSEPFDIVGISMIDIFVRGGIVYSCKGSM